MTDMMIGYILLGFGIVLIIILTLIYQKINKKPDNESKEEISNLLASKVREKVVEVITEKYSKIEERVAEMQNVGKNLEDFRNIFTNKTERGKLGEDWLEDIIRDAVSKKYYEKQYTFSNGKRVDFLLNFGSVIIATSKQLFAGSFSTEKSLNVFITSLIIFCALEAFFIKVLITMLTSTSSWSECQQS